jgi:hypothetical protein
VFCLFGVCVPLDGDKSIFMRAVSVCVCVRVFADDLSNIELALECGFPRAIHSPAGFTTALMRTVVCSLSGSQGTVGFSGVGIDYAADADCAFARRSHPTAVDERRADLLVPLPVLVTTVPVSDDHTGNTDGIFVSLPPPSNI